MCYSCVLCSVALAGRVAPREPSADQFRPWQVCRLTVPVGRCERPTSWLSLPSDPHAQFIRGKAHTLLRGGRHFSTSGTLFLSSTASYAGSMAKREGNPLIYRHVLFLCRGTGAFSHLIINVLNRMVLGTLTSVTPNGVGLIIAVAGLIFPQSARKHGCL